MTVAVLIPALNEERSIGRVIRAIPEDRVDRILIVDNGSSDTTADVARRSGAEVIQQMERGYGAACLAGIAHLSASPPDVLVFMDGDFSDFPEELPEVAAPILGNEADLVIGSRTEGTSEEGALLPQARFGNWLACRLIRLIWGEKYTDLGPFRAIRWSSLEALDMQDRNYGWTVEMQIKAVREGLRIREVPVSYRKRIGTSKVTGTISGTIKAGIKILWTIGRFAFARTF